VTGRRKVAVTTTRKARVETPGRPAVPPTLTPFDGERLEPHRDYDALDFVDGDFTGQDASDAMFMECRLQRCCLDGTSMRRARLVESVLADCRAASVDLADSTWRESGISGGRLGAVTLAGATWTGVRVRGAKIGFANLARATLEDVVFEGCEIGGLDLRAARARSMRFVDCTIDELNVAGTTLSGVDLTGARLRSLIGVESLRGAIVSPDQLHDLAPLLAAELGIEVRADEPEDRADAPRRRHEGVSER
jgi:uncharacterized protein YjbI with pentapeptide repeats